MWLYNKVSIKFNLKYFFKNRNTGQKTLLLLATSFFYFEIINIYKNN